MPPVTSNRNQRNPIMFVCILSAIFAPPPFSCHAHAAALPGIVFAGSMCSLGIHLEELFEMLVQHALDIFALCLAQPEQSTARRRGSAAPPHHHHHHHWVLRRESWVGTKDMERMLGSSRELHLSNTPQFHHFNTLRVCDFNCECMCVCACVYVCGWPTISSCLFPARTLVNKYSAEQENVCKCSWKKAKQLFSCHRPLAMLCKHATHGCTAKPKASSSCRLTWPGPRCRWRRECSTAGAICGLLPCPAHWPVHASPGSSALPPCCRVLCVASAEEREVRWASYCCIYSIYRFLHRVPR